MHKIKKRDVKRDYVMKEYILQDKKRIGWPISLGTWLIIQQLNHVLKMLKSDSIILSGLSLT